MGVLLRHCSQNLQRKLPWSPCLQYRNLSMSMRVVLRRRFRGSVQAPKSHRDHQLQTIRRDLSSHRRRHGRRTRFHARIPLPKLIQPSFTEQHIDSSNNLHGSEASRASASPLLSDLSLHHLLGKVRSFPSSQQWRMSRRNGWVSLIAVAWAAKLGWVSGLRLAERLRRSSGGGWRSGCGGRPAAAGGAAECRYF